MFFFLRPIRVFLALLPFIISFLRDWQCYIFFGPPLKRTQAEHRRRARRLTATLASLGPTFIKGAQVLGMREDLLPRVYTSELKTLQDRVPPFPVRDVLATIRRSLGRPAREIFDSFDPEPLAAASLGQVHRAVYKGRPVALKVLRPNVQKIIETDLAVVRFIVRLFYLFVESHYIRSFWAILTEYMRMIHQELDFRNEEDNAGRFRRAFAREPRVHIPECFSELTTRETVAFGYVEGVRVDDADGVRAQGVEPSELIARLIEIYVRMAVVDGYIHADPHPGNLLVDRQGRIVILDYGMALEFPEDIRRQMLRACIAIVRDDIDTLVDIYYSLGMVDRDINRSLVRDAAETLLSISLREDFTPRMIQDIADDILATFHKFPLRMPQQLVYLFRASALIEGLGLLYDPHFSGVREATPIVKRMLREIALEPKKPIPHQVRDTAQETVRTLRYIQRIIVRLEHEEQRIRVHQGDIQILENLMGALLRRLLAGLGSVGAALFAALVYAETGSLWVLLLILPPSTLVFWLCVTLPLRRHERLR